MDKITIIILTHNRHNYLARILEYFSNSNFNILVADSSENIYKEKVYDNVRYYHFPNELPLQKIINILQKVTAPYMCFCADDDFWVKSSLLNSIDFLEENNDYACVQGKYLNFKYRHKKIEFIPAYYLCNNNIIDDDIIKRINSLMHNYMPLFYAVHRTEHVKSFFEDVIKFEINHPIIIELMFSLYAVIAGKYYTIEKMSYVRDRNSEPTELDRSTLDQIIDQSEYKNELKRFKLGVESYIQRITSSEENFYVQVEEAIDLYVSKLRIKKNKTKSINLIRFFKFISPNFITKYIRILLNRGRRKKICSLYSNKAGYPGSDEIANNAWEEISLIIHKYDIK